MQEALDIAKVVIPLALAVLSGAWFIARKLIFDPLQSVAQKLDNLSDKFIALEARHEIRLASVENQIVRLEERVS